MNDDWLSNTYLVADEEGGVGARDRLRRALRPAAGGGGAAGRPGAHAAAHPSPPRPRGRGVRVAGRGGARAPARGGASSRAWTARSSRARRSTSAGCTWRPCTRRATPPGCSTSWSTAATCSRATRSSRARSAACARPGPPASPTCKHSIMEVLMKLPHETRVQPGHTDPTTIGDEWEGNAFVRLWRGLDEEGDEPCQVWETGRDARPVGAGLRRRPQGLGALARRQRRHRPGQPGRAQLA